MEGKDFDVLLAFADVNADKFSDMINLAGGGGSLALNVWD